MAGKIQGADIKTEAELITAGATKSSLPRDTQIYVSANSINKTLDQAIIDGDIGSGGGGGAASAIRLHTGNGFGSTNTKIRRFTTSVQSTGSDITYTDSATNGASFTVNTAGVYAIAYTDEGDTGAPHMGISLNSSQLTTDLSAITAANRLVGTNFGTGNERGSVAVTVLLAANDVIRAHTNSGTAGFISAPANAAFAIVGPLAEGKTIVAAKYTATTLTNSIPNTSSPTIFDCPTSVYDTHSAVTTGATWKFTVPANQGGKYDVSALVTLGSFAWTVNDYFIADVFVNGSAVSSLNWHGMQASWTGQLSVGGKTTISVAASDEISVAFLSSRTGGSITSVEANAIRNHIEIIKVG